MEFIPDFGGFAFTLLAFIAALSVIVAIHEYGHYIVGRWSGIHAEVFSIGFGPVLLSRVDRHGTKWQLAALPFGGYVKFLGDSDAASGKDAAAIDALDVQERRRSMHGAPLWARAATVAAGPIFNFILSIIIFAGVLMVSGRPVEAPIVGAPAALPAERITLQEGDLILAVDGQPVETLSELYATARDLAPSPTLDYRVERAGEEMTVTASFLLLPLVQSVTPQSAAIEAGLEEGDLIEAVNGTPIYAFSELREAVDASAGAPMDLTIWRDGARLPITLSPRRTDLPTADGGFETRWLIGISGGLIFDPVTERVGLWSAIVSGADQTWFVVRSSLSGLWHMITGAISSCNLQGPIGIAETSGAAASQGLDNFIWFIAVLSTAVGLLNLFPIPVLDGGHLMFHAYEAVSGKPPSDKALRVFMTVGLTLLLSLMLFALTNDLFCP
ncbi:Membrane-associated zinc metalloprotease [Roseibacterium elongatum DSM 19469]|uniref:Zinc metalloprotease n=1 Tax=Roseicyclus elongatus DSM 19469 TaxID=1294273 RepID=W8SR58_9RHOB|nr:RIP metalloprotease RseP [Roseibacterium elongatum]AHM05000.1 Membrane-associated zinc metalloprotease [Roseibacterium elongatum DSM 19469]